MKFSKMNLLTLFLGVLAAIFWLVTPMMGDAPDEHPKRFSEWMRSLPGETRMQVENVFEQNMDCLVAGNEKSSPDHNKWIKNVYQGLQEVLAPAELAFFDELLKGNTQGDCLASTAAKCPSCYSGADKLDQAYGYLNSAQTSYQRYHSSYCDFGIGPDSVEIYIGLAIYYTDSASQHATNAYNTCNCDSAVQAVYDARKARTYTNTALRNTYYDCGSNAPWINYIFSAKGYIDSAILKLSNGCNNEACH